MSKTYSSSVFKPFNGDISAWPSFKRSCIVAANGLQLQNFFPTPGADAGKPSASQLAALSDLYLAMYAALVDEALIHVDEAALSGDPIIIYRALCAVYEDRSTEVCKALRDRFERCTQRGRSIALFLGELATIQASLTANGQPYSEDDMLARMSAGIDPAFQLQANILTLTPGMTFASARLKMVKYGMTKDHPRVDSLPMGQLALQSSRHIATSTSTSSSDLTHDSSRDSSRPPRFKKCVNCGELGHFAEACQRRECSACGGHHLYRDCFARLGLTTAAQRQQHIAKTRALHAPKSGNVATMVSGSPSFVHGLDDNSDDDEPIMAFTMTRLIEKPVLSLPRYIVNDSSSDEDDDDLPLSAFTVAGDFSALAVPVSTDVPPLIYSPNILDGSDESDLGLSWGCFNHTAMSISPVSYALASLSSAPSLQSAIVDSGATDHFTAREDLLRDAVPLATSSQVFMANSAPLTLTASGNFSSLPGSCYLAPDISNSLISVPRLDEAGLVTIIKSGVLLSGTLPPDMQHLLERIMRVLWTPQHCALFASLIRGLYRADVDNLTGLDSNTPHLHCNIALYPRFHCSSLRDLVRSCHEAWGHMSQADMISIVRRAVFPGIPPLLTVSAIRRNWYVCKACIEGTLTATPLPHHSVPASPSALSSVGDLVCIDGYGKVSPPSFGGYQYWVISVCAFSHYIHCELVKSRSEYPAAVAAIIAHYQNHGHSIKVIQSDAEFLSSRIQTLCDLHHIALRSSAPHEHAQNGVAERHNRTLAEKITVSLRVYPNTPKEAWALAMHDSSFKLNIRPILSDHRTPYEVFHGKQLDLTKVMLLPFGLPVAAHVPSDLRHGSFDAHTFDGIVVGSAPQYKLAVQVLNLQTLRVNIRRSLVPLAPSELDTSTQQPLVDDMPVDGANIDIAAPSLPLLSWSTPNPYAPLTTDVEDAIDAPAHSSVPPDSTSPTLLSAPPPLPESPLPVPPQVNSSPATILPAAPSSPHERTSDSTSSPSALEVDELIASPASAPASLPNSTTSLQPIVPPSNVSSSGRPIRVPSRFANALSSLTSSFQEDPLSLLQALQRTDAAMWLAALDDEMVSLKARGTFVSVTFLPTNTRPLATKFVFKRVVNPDGSVKKYKVRLVVRGDMQTTETFKNTCAGTVQRKSVFLLLALAAHYQCDICTLDIKSAFLYADLTEDIYITLPKSYTDPGPRQHCKLLKSLYGLKQAAFEFAQLLCSVLLEFGFIRLTSDPQVFMKCEEGRFLVLCTHVDDILIVSNDSAYLELFTAYLATRFEITMNAVGDSYIGMSITRDRSSRSMFLSQRGYVQQLISKHCIHPHFVSTPADYSHHGDNDDVLLSATDRLDFMRVVGALNYLAHCTRPDILYAVHSLSTKFAAPTESDRRRAQRVLNYLYSTPDFGISFTATPQIGLYGHADASFANGPSRRSEHGLCYSLSPDSNFFYAVTKVQNIISVSSTEAEYIAASECSKELRWLQHFLSELPIFPVDFTPAILYQDNMSTIQLASQTKYYERSKHIDLRYHFIRFHIAQGHVRVLHRDTAKMIADMFTKPLLPHRFIALRTMLLGLQPSTAEEP